MYFPIDKEHNYLDDRGLTLFAKHDLDHLKNLTLKANHFSSRSLAQLLRKGMPSLTQLDLSQNKLEAEAVEAVGKVGHKLRILDLSSCQLGWDGVEKLLDLSLPNLQVLQLDYNNLS